MKDTIERWLNPVVKLEEGDIVHVPRRGWARFGQVLNKAAFVVGFALLDSFAKP